MAEKLKGNTQNSDKLYNVIMSGKIIKGKQINHCKAKLAEVFHVDVSKVEPYCAGKIKVVKRNLTHDKAKKYQYVINSTGFHCYIKPSEESSDQIKDTGQPNIAQEDAEAAGVNTKKNLEEKSSADDKEVQRSLQESEHNVTEDEEVDEPTEEATVAINELNNTKDKKTANMSKSEELEKDEDDDDEEDDDDDETDRVIHQEFPGVQIPPINQKNIDPPPPFMSVFGEVFAYPFIGSGKWLLIAGAVTYTLFSYIPFIGLIVQLISLGYMSAYMMKIIDSSARGDKELPDWPDFSDMWDDVIRPFFMMIGALIVSQFLTITYLVSSSNFFPIFDPIFWILFLLGMLYFPMSLLTMSLARSIAGLNPVLVIKTIIAVPVEYLLILVFIFVVVIVEAFGKLFIISALPIPFVLPVILTLITIYFYTIEMRLLGMLYYCNQDKFDWTIE